jgi:hypothetical protein
MSDARQQLAEEMDRRRAKLRLRWRQVAERAKLDESTLRRVRAGQLALTTYVKEGIEQALEWKEGSVDAILANKEPTPIDPPPPAAPLLLDEFEEELWAIPELSEGMKWDRIMARRRRKRQPPTAGDEGADGRPSGTKGSWS